VIVSFVDIGGIVDHHCLEVIVRFVDIGGIDDHYCLSLFFHKKLIDSSNIILLFEGR
jgi:hypothetical protein